MAMLRSAGVDAGDGRAQPGQRLAEQAAAAADVEDAQALERPHRALPSRPKWRSGLSRI